MPRMSPLGRGARLPVVMRVPIALRIVDVVVNIRRPRSTTYGRVSVRASCASGRSLGCAINRVYGQRITDETTDQGVVDILDSDDGTSIVAG